MERPRPSPTAGFSVVVRPAHRSDAEKIAEIYNEAVRSTTATFDTHPRSTAAQRSRLEQRDAAHPVLVAELGSEVVGWAALSPWSDRPAYAGTAEVSVYVAEKWRGRRIGRTLLGGLIGAGSAAGLHTLVARIAEGNPASRRLHIAAGFTTIGVMREVGNKFGRFLDVELMQLMLVSSLRPSGGRTVQRP
jgi:L-amino acid N-acyltransferase